MHRHCLAKNWACCLRDAECTHLLQALNAGQHPILALKNAKIGDFNGRTLSTTSSTSVTLDPDIPEAGHLRQWYVQSHLSGVEDQLALFAAPIALLIEPGL